MLQQINNFINQQDGIITSHDDRNTILNSESQNTIIYQEDDSMAGDGEDTAAETFFPGSSDEDSIDKSPSEKKDLPSIDDEEIIEDDDDIAKDKEIKIEEEAVDEESPEITDEQEIEEKVF